MKAAALRKFQPSIPRLLGSTLTSWATAGLPGFPDLIIDKNEEAKGHGDQPPLVPEGTGEMARSRLLPGVCPQAHLAPTAHSPSPNGHEVEDVGHARAVAQEAAMQTWNTMAITRILFLQVGRGGTDSDRRTRDKDRPGGDGRLDGHQGAGSRGQIAAAEMF